MLEIPKYDNAELYKVRRGWGEGGGISVGVLCQEGEKKRKKKDASDWKVLEEGGFKKKKKGCLKGRDQDWRLLEAEG